MSPVLAFYSFLCAVFYHGIRQPKGQLHIGVSTLNCLFVFQRSSSLSASSHLFLWSQALGFFCLGLFLVFLLQTWHLLKPLEITGVVQK